jgi:choline dehydrogenase
MPGGRYDYLIVGGGSAGCALANRLSADPSNRVLVLEAGRRDYRWDVFIQMPAALTYPIGNRFYDWKYESEPEPHMGGRRVYHARGKVLGGSSSINGMIFQRGNPMDYERWAGDAGMQTWDYASCLPYFRKMEDCTAAAPDDPFRGHGGPLTLERGPATNPLFEAFFAATVQAGYPRTEDVNGYRQEGFAPFDRNIRRGRRWSAARAYLYPVLNRPNLELVTGAFVRRVIIEGARASGVDYEQGNARRTAYAETVILCGGAINTPQLLQVSGVGNAAELGQLGIQVHADLPGVGENLLDHPESVIVWETHGPIPDNSAMDSDAGLFVRRDPEHAGPDLMFHFYQIPFTDNPERLGYERPEFGVSMTPNIPKPKSRGRLYLTSPDPSVKPALDFRYFTDEDDYDGRTLVDGIRIARRIAETEPLAGWLKREVCPGPDITGDEELSEYARRAAHTVYHPAGTCRMGAADDELAVVDPELRIRGLDGIRIADASVFPTMTAVNPMIGVLMVGEKAADLIGGGA